MTAVDQHTDLARWEALAATDWDYSPEQMWFHTAILHPAITEIVERHRPSTILDFGCGRGHLSAHLRSKGFTPDLYDPVPGMAAVPPSGRAIADLAATPRAAYDLIVANLVLSAVEDVPATLGSMVYILDDQGLLIVSVPHPVFVLLDALHATTSRMWRSGRARNVLEGLDRYFDEDVQDVVWHKSGTPTSLYHRTVSDYTAAFQAAGLAVTQILEPRPVEDAPDVAGMSHLFQMVPAFMVFCVAKKD